MSGDPLRTANVLRVASLMPLVVGGSVQVNAVPPRSAWPTTPPIPRRVGARTLARALRNRGK